MVIIGDKGLDRIGYRLDVQEYYSWPRVGHGPSGHRQPSDIRDMWNSEAYPFMLPWTDRWDVGQTLYRSEEIPSHLVIYYVSKLDICILTLPRDDALDPFGNFVVSF